MRTPSGPHLYVGTPFNKTPREGCKHNQDYDAIDLEAIDDDYLPRTNYVPACSAATYLERAPEFKGQVATAVYRGVVRQMVAVTGERTLVPALIPPEAAHINTVLSFAFAVPFDLCAWSGMCAALPIDSLVRARGAGHIHFQQALDLPLPSTPSSARSTVARWLRLNCVTTHYADLWNEVWPQSTSPGWSSSDPRLSPWPAPSARWSRASAVRNAFERRWALRTTPSGSS